MSTLFRDNDLAACKTGSGSQPAGDPTERKVAVLHRNRGKNSQTFRALTEAKTAESKGPPAALGSVKLHTLAFAPETGRALNNAKVGEVEQWPTVKHTTAEPRLELDVHTVPDHHNPPNTPPPGSIRPEPGCSCRRSPRHEGIFVAPLSQRRWSSGHRGRRGTRIGSSPEISVYRNAPKPVNVIP